MEEEEDGGGVEEEDGGGVEAFGGGRILVTSEAKIRCFAPSAGGWLANKRKMWQT